MAIKKFNEASNYLSIDYGKSKLGLATANSEVKIAFSYGTIANDNKMLQVIKNIVEQEEIGTVVIGLPQYKKGQSDQKIYEEFGASLQKEVPGVKIVFADEMFTTKMAQDNLKEKGMKKIKGHDHTEAAKIILQEWLDSTVIKKQ